MKNTILKISTLTLLASHIYAGEIQVGKGNFEMSGGFMGMSQTLSTDVTTYSLVQQHANLFSSDWFYKYNITWYDSSVMTQAHDTVIGMLNMTPASIITPAIDYKMQGLDANIVLGNDLIHKGENDYLGLGLMVGFSMPWIESSNAIELNYNLGTNMWDMMQNSKTKMLTYKVGPSISVMKSLNKHFMFYASATYAYQTGTFKNSYAHFDLKVDGIYQEYDVGIKFQPVSEDYDMGWITISPRFYATLGYRYTSWDLGDISMDVTGMNIDFMKTDFNMNSSIAYFGWGYSF
jgi:hypothetical protein